MSWSIECGIYHIPFSLEADHARDFYERPSLILVRRGGVSPRRAVRNIASGLTRQPVRVVKVIITRDKRRDSSSTCRDETRLDETRRDVLRARWPSASFFTLPEIFRVERDGLSRPESDIVLLKVRNKSQPERGKEAREEAKGDQARRGQGRVVGRSVFEGRQSDAPPSWEIALNLLNSKLPPSDQKEEASPLREHRGGIYIQQPGRAALVSCAT